MIKFIYHLLTKNKFGSYYWKKKFGSFGNGSYIQGPLILIVLVSLLLGALLIFLFSSISSFKNNRQNKANLKEIKQLQNKIEELEAKIGVETEVKDEKQVTEENSDNEDEEK